MPNPRTPSTSDFSTLETKDRNDNTTLANTTPKPERTETTEYPDTSTGNEFEVEKRNEVHPDQSHNTELTEDEQQTENAKNEAASADEDWDTTKNK